MPALIAPLLGLVLGSLLGWAAFSGDREGLITHTRGFLSSALLGLFVYAPVNAYLFAFYPDWSFAYRLPESSFTRALALGFVLLDAVSIPAALWFCQWNGRRERSRQSVLTPAVPVALVTTVVLFVSLPRLTVVTTYAGYAGGFGLRPVAGTDLGYALLWFCAILSAAVYWTARVLQTEG